MEDDRCMGFGTGGGVNWNIVPVFWFKAISCCAEVLTMDGDLCIPGKTSSCCGDDLTKDDERAPGTIDEAPRGAMYGAAKSIKDWGACCGDARNIESDRVKLAS